MFYFKIEFKLSVKEQKFSPSRRRGGKSCDSLDDVLKPISKTIVPNFLSETLLICQVLLDGVEVERACFFEPELSSSL